MVSGICPPPLVYYGLWYFPPSLKFSEFFFQRIHICICINICTRTQTHTHTHTHTIGHSRIPVYVKTRQNVVGVLIVKNIILVDPRFGV